MRVRPFVCGAIAGMVLVLLVEVTGAPGAPMFAATLLGIVTIGVALFWEAGNL